MQIFVKFSYTIIEAKFLKKNLKKMGTVRRAEVAARVLTWVCLHFQLGNKKICGKKMLSFSDFRKEINLGLGFWGSFWTLL